MHEWNSRRRGVSRIAYRLRIGQPRFRFRLNFRHRMCVVDLSELNTDLEPGSNKNNASNRTPNFLVGGQSPKLLQHILIVACVYLFIRSVVQRIVSYCILIRFLYCIIYINVCRVVNGTSSKCSIVFQGFEDIGVVVNWIASLRFVA